MEPIPYAKHTIDQDDIDAVTAVLRSDFLTQGPGVSEFENALATACGSRYAVVFANGTAALHGAYFAAGIGPGDEFITTPITFVASANAGLYMGAAPVLCDISMEDYLIDQDRLWRLISPRTKVITPVSYAGYPAELEALHKKAAKAGIVVIHDAAHALGAVRRGAPVGRHADMTMLSFHPAKHAAAGEGGAILTDNEVYFRRLVSFRSHGITKNPAELTENHGGWYYEMQALGFNYRLTDMQCALGLSQLKKLDVSLKRRKEIADRYRAELRLDWLTLPPEPEDGAHAFHLYPVLVNADRRRFYDYLHANGIKAQVHYIPVHYMPYYKEAFGFKPGDFPVAEEFYSREVSLPMFPGLTDGEQSYVIDTVRGYDA